MGLTLIFQSLAKKKKSENNFGYCVSSFQAEILKIAIHIFITRYIPLYLYTYLHVFIPIFINQENLGPPNSNSWKKMWIYLLCRVGV